MRLSERYEESNSPLHRRDARVKMIACFALVACAASADWRHPERLGVCAVLFLALLVLGRISPVLVLRRSLVVLPFLLVPALSAPFLRSPAGAAVSPWALVAWVAGRSWLSAAVLVTLAISTRYADLLDGAARMGVPRILVTLGSFLYRYLFVLAEEAGRMRLARDLRGGGRATLAAGSRVAGTLIAALFLRTYDRAERIHQCMLARGFEGESRRVPPQPLKRADWAFLLLFAAGTTAAYLI